jgi:hypothetical protein
LEADLCIASVPAVVRRRKMEMAGINVVPEKRIPHCEAWLSFGKSRGSDMVGQDTTVDQHGEEADNPLDACQVGRFPEDILERAKIEHLQAALNSERAALAVLQTQCFDPVSDSAKRFHDLETRVAQLLNALNKAESAKFWEAVTGGCSAQLAAVEETDPAIVHAQALYRQWQTNRRKEIEARATAVMRADMSPSGRALRAMELTEEVLTEEVTYRLNVYREVADKPQNLEMIAPQHLDRLRCRIAHNVALGLVARRHETSRYFSAAGWTQPQPQFMRYMHAAFRVLETADAALAVLRTDYDLRHKQQVPVPDTALGRLPSLGTRSLDHLLDGKEEVTIRIAAEYLGKTVDHVTRLARSGKITVTRMSRPKLVSTRSVRAYLRPGS